MKTLLCCVVIACILGSPAVHGAILVVGLGHYASIGAAVTAAASGDTVVVEAGTYTGPPNRNVLVGAKNLVIRSVNGALDTIIDCEGVDRAFNMQSAVTDSTTIIQGFTFTHGWASVNTDDGGGAIVCYLASPTIEDCVFVDNEGSSGGAIKALYCDPRTRDCVFSENTAVRGGAIAMSYSHPVIERCTFYDNAASEDGGALRCYENSPISLILRNCTMVGNGSPHGGAIAGGGNHPAPVVRRCIIAFGTQGGVIWGADDAEFENCIVFGNTGGDGLQGNAHDNAFEDPLLCDLYADDFTLCANSLGLIANNTWGVDVGSLGQGCANCDTPVASTTWGAIKALYR